MAKFKNIRIKKKGGGSRTQRVQVLASGKYKFVKNKSRSSRVTKSKSKKTYKRRKYNLVRRRKRGRRRKSFTIPLAPIGGLMAGMAGPIESAMNGDLTTALALITRNYTGFDTNTNQLHLPNLQFGLLPLAVGLLVHKFVGGAPLHANRMLAQAGVPVIRI